MVSIRNFNAVLSIRPVLVAVTSAYLVAPSLIFIFFWFRWEVSALAIPLGIGLGAYHVVRSVRHSFQFDIRPSGLIKLMFVAVLIVYFSGIGGFSIQSYDHWGHNAKFFELANLPWPISYKEPGTFACYYYGYYLVPAALYKLLAGHLNLLVICWAGLGIYLIVIWYYLLLRNRLFALFLFLFGGIPHLVLNALPFYDGVIIQQCKLYFLGFAQALLWQPHQSIPAALLAALIIHSVSANLRYSLVFFLACNCIVWGPFVFIGALGAVSLAFAIEWLRDRSSFVFSRYWSKPDGLNFVYIMPLLIYFMSSSNTSGLATIVQSGAYWPLCYVTFLVLNLAVFFFIMAVSRRSAGHIPSWLLGAFSFLCMVSFFKMGVYNDLVCKASMPALYLIYFEMARLFTERKSLQIGVRSLVLLNVFMFVSVISTFDIMKRQFENNVVSSFLLGRSFPVIPYHTYANSYEMLKAKYSQAEAGQYLGSEKSIYRKYLYPREPR